MPDCTILRAYSHQASTLTLAITSALTFEMNALVSITTFTPTVSINISVKIQMGSWLIQKRQSCGSVWTRPKFQVILLISVLVWCTTHDSKSLTSHGTDNISTFTFQDNHTYCKNTSFTLETNFLSKIQSLLVVINAVRSVLLRPEFFLQYKTSTEKYCNNFLIYGRLVWS